MNEDHHADNARALTAEIVTSYVAHNSLRSDDLTQLIASVYGALMNLSQPSLETAAEPLQRPMSVKKSITPDYLISMEDGRQYKSLKRHLTKRGLTPADYRAKWDLPNDYPMVAANYAAARSALAKSFGLGQKRSKAAAARRAEAEVPVADEAEPASEKPKRGRKKAEATEQDA